MGTRLLSASASLLVAACCLAPIALAQNLDCIQRAIDDRGVALRDTYRHFFDQINDAINRMGDADRNSLSGNYQYGNSAQAIQEYDRMTSDAWQRLSTDVQYAWSNYYRNRAQCSGVSVPGYGGYGSSYNYYNSSSYCPHTVLPTAPAGCVYGCGMDSNGCQTCRLQCRTSVSFPACNCPSTAYSPVCTRDNRTYDNACLAICNGGTVWHAGAC